MPEEGEPGAAGVGVAAEEEEEGVEIVRVEGAAEEMGRMGAWRECVVVAAADAMIERGFG